jgi:phosphoheptose isomerase
MNFSENYGESLQALIVSHSNQIDSILESMYLDYKANKTFILAGNGGNFANVLHMGTDWTKGLYTSCGVGMNLRILGSNPSLLSAVENDIGHEKSLPFLLELESCDANCVVILFSAGGTSRNILVAAEKAKETGAKVVGIMGGKNFNSSNLFDQLLHINNANMQLVEDIHSIFGHMLLKYFIQRQNGN